MDQDHTAILRAACARVLPSDDGPGAEETGVAEYVAHVLGEDRLSSFAPYFELGLAYLETLAQEQHGKGFTQCEPELQDQVMEAASKAEQPVFQAFFRQMVSLSLEGFLGDPRHGGNRDGLGWRYVGYEPDPQPGNEEARS